MVVGDMELSVDLAVIGGGPGGYAAAFRAADLGLEVALIDDRSLPGGVCLHEGCIPSKTYLHLAEMILDCRGAKPMGLHFAEPKIDLPAIRQWKKRIVEEMAGGLKVLSSKREIQLIRGWARFADATTLRLENADISRIKFANAIIASGSAPITLPDQELIFSERVMSSSAALELMIVPESMLIIGGGYVGLELGTIYAALGSSVSVVERRNQLLPGVDQDLVEPLAAHLGQLFHTIHLNTEIVSLREKSDGVDIQIRQNNITESIHVEKVLIAIGRRPVTENIGLENIAVEKDGRGAIQTDESMRTTEKNIYAVGDVTGNFMLAHTAIRQGRVAAESIAGKPSAYDVRAVPAVVYTDPQIAWCGLTETEARKTKAVYSVEKFPWKYSGRAQSMGATAGFTKILAHPDDGRILGAGIVGRETEGLIAEIVLAIEMGATMEDLALSLHPHPTLSETEGEAAEMFLGSPTHLLPKTKKTKE